MWKTVLVLSVLLLTTPFTLADEPKADAGQPKLPALDPDRMTDPKEAARAAELLEKLYAGSRQPEAVRMLISILRKGPDLGGSDGWFGPAETRYTWKWLLAQNHLAADARSIPREKFRGDDAWFDQLDRDGDGQITPGDLDWSEQNPYNQQAALVNRLFRRMNVRGDGKLTREDLDEFFKRVAGGKDHVTPADLRKAMISAAPGGFLPGDAPTTAVLVRSLFAGELGSMNEGPHLDETAPDFALKSSDGKTTVQLSKLVGTKPVVLVLGNFTCGPFRALFPEVDATFQKHKADANFAMVYVREAHPTDGWRMEANAKVGVAVKQPTTFGERAKVCDQFCAKVKPTMPVVVDEINDPVGNAYSGMPGRLYVIDTKGKVAYKSGRGPFGFLIGEFQQALVMALMEATAEKKP